MLRVEHLSKSFGGVRATKDVSIDFPAGSLTAIIGPNGAGKTTFFNLISGHVRPDEGRVLFDGADIVGLSSLEVVRRGMARAFQVAALFPSLTVREALTAAVVSHRRGSARVLSRFPVPEAVRRADAIMEMLGSAPRRRSCRPTSRTATRSSSTSGSPWRWSRRCCSSTSRPPAWAPRSAGG